MLMDHLTIIADQAGIGASCLSLPQLAISSTKGTDCGTSSGAGGAASSDDEGASAARSSRGSWHVPSYRCVLGGCVQRAVLAVLSCVLGYLSV